MILLQLNTTPSSSSCFLYLSSTIPELNILTLCQERSSAALPPSLHLRPVSPGACTRQVLMPFFQRVVKMPGWVPCRGKDTLGIKGEMKGTCIGCKQQKAPRMGQGHNWRGRSAPKWLKSGRAWNLQAAGLWGSKTTQVSNSLRKEMLPLLSLQK